MKNVSFRIMLRVMPLFVISFADCQPKNVTWRSKVGRISENEVALTLTANVAPGWHLYSQYLEDNGPQPTRFTFQSDKGVLFSGFDEKGDFFTYYDEIFEMDVTWYTGTVEFKGAVRLTQPVAILTGTIEYMTCNAQVCVPEKYNMNIQIDLTKKIP